MSRVFNYNNRGSVYLSVFEQDYNYILQCSGIEIAQPWFQFEGGRITVTTNLRPNPMPFDHHCDNEDYHYGELALYHPELIKRNQPEFLADGSNFHWSSPYFFWLALPPFHFGWVKYSLISWPLEDPIVGFLTTHYAYRDYCQQNHPDIDSTVCAGAYFFQRRCQDYTFLGIPKNFYNNFKTMEES